MTTQTEALKLALDYLYDHRMGGHVIAAIKEALAQPEQEPVAYCDIHHLPEPCVQCAKEHEGYNIPPQPKETEQEPVAWRAWFDADNSAKWLFTLWPEEEHPSFDWQPLYTTPPKRKPLTKDEILAVGGVVAHGNVFFINIKQLNRLVGIKEDV